MTILELINNLAMLIIGGIMLMAFAILIIRGIGEEQRKNSDHAVNALDKIFAKAGQAATEVVKSINAIMRDEQQRNELEAYKRMRDRETTL